jgi:hypothetical protein
MLNAMDGAGMRGRPHDDVSFIVAVRDEIASGYDLSASQYLAHDNIPSIIDGAHDLPSTSGRNARASIRFVGVA